MLPEPTSGLIQDCAKALGLTRSEIVSIAITAPKRYKVYQIPKRSGGMRTICHPSRELKGIQRTILRTAISLCPVHSCATAYESGTSIRQNAELHRKSRVIMKLDFSNFFNSIRVGDWYSYADRNLKNWTLEEKAFSAYCMFWGAGTYHPVCLSIGAPTSPHLSNMLLFSLDENLSRYAFENNMVYTRYADDITFSSQGYIEKDETLRVVKAALEVMKSPKLEINDSKTLLASKANARRVTGLVLTNDDSISLGRDRKRMISAMIHREINGRIAQEERQKLYGLLAFAKDVEPSFISAMSNKYGEESMQRIIRRLVT